MKKALLIIDVQNDYFPGGKNELVQPTKALQTISALINNFRAQQLPVFYIQHISSKHARFFLPDSQGAAIHQDIAPLEHESVIVKHYPNSFYQTTLHDELTKAAVQHIVICGMMTHMCIDTTVRASKDLGYQTTLIADGCATKDLEYNGTFLSAKTVQEVSMASLDGVFTHVTAYADYILNQTTD